MIGIIGGSGIYNMDIKAKDEREIETPFGKPSDKIVTGKFEGHDAAFLARHGRNHTITPSQINYRANIFAFKDLGVDRILSIQAVGSLKEDLKPLHIVVPDQLIDRTKGRESSFFDSGIAAHISFAEPFCPELSKKIVEIVKFLGHDVHDKGTYLCMEGPAFSTRAESDLHRQFADIIGMTASPEAKLAREAEICYASISTVTDYDCWKDEDVSVEMILDYLKKNEEAVHNIIKKVVPEIPDDRRCGCKDALAGAILTPKDKISQKTKKDLSILIGKYTR